MKSIATRVVSGLVLVSFLLFSGCTSLPPKQPTGLAAEAVAKEQAKRDALTRRISGKVGLRLQGKDGSLSGKGRLLSQAPGEFRLELRDPLGRVQYVIAEEGERLTAYYPRQKLSYVEKQWGRHYVKRFLGLDFSFPELRDLFLGLLPPRWRKARLQSWQWDASAGAYRATLSDEKDRVTLWVDGDTAALSALSVETGGERVKVTYSDFDRSLGEGNMPGSGIALAHDVKVELEQPASAVEIDWQTIERLDHPKDASVFQLALPPDVKREEL